MSIGTVGALTAEPSIDLLVPLGTTSAITTGGTAGDPARATLLIAAELAGMAAATTAQSVSYGMDREQFGQPVGGFQAVKHRCADMAVRAEAALTQVHYAALSLRDQWISDVETLLGDLKANADAAVTAERLSKTPTSLLANRSASTKCVRPAPARSSIACLSLRVGS